MADFATWKNGVLGQILDSDNVPQDKGQCSQVPISWAEYLFPGVKWSDLLVPVEGVKDWAGKSTKYFTWIENDVNDVNQLPLQGDVLVFDATPKKGYASQFKNPYGHSGVCDTATPTGYTIVQQNAPYLGESVNDSSYTWKMIPCLGWFRPVNQPANATPLPSPSSPPHVAPTNSINVGRVLNLPKSVSQWHVYNVAGPYDLAHATHVLDPAQYGGLSYVIKQDLGNGIYVISTQMFGDVAIWTKDTAATITGTEAEAAPAEPALNTKPITVEQGWGLEKVAEAAGIPNPSSPNTWQKIAEANGSSDWQAFNKALKPGQVVEVPLS